MVKYIRQRKQSTDDWFQSVVNNGLGFLKSSISNLDKSPRNSIIDLYTAIELFFKARLMKEHWSLILSKPEDANKDKFENGDFHSVYLEQAEKRLKNICGEKFKKEAIENFKVLNEHRNQIVHFAHTDFSGSESDVVIEHWASWFFLHDLITNQWVDVFHEFQDKIDVIHKQVIKNRGFLEAKYHAVTSKIKIEVKKGSEIISCTSCEFESGVVIKSNVWGKDFECLVCNVKDLKLIDITTTIPCNYCGIDLSYFLLKKHTCPDCQKEITLEYALEKYTIIYKEDDPEARYDDGVEPIAYCHNCVSDVPTVINIEGLWVCVMCEDRGWTALDCEHCGSFVTGDTETIQYFACHRCEDEVREAFKVEMEEYENKI